MTSRGLVRKSEGAEYIGEVITEQISGHTGVAGTSGNQGGLVFNAGFPTSGTSGTRAGTVNPGTLLLDTTNLVMFVNEGTKASPYWTPVSYDQPGLHARHTRFEDLIGKALTDTAIASTLTGSGLRIFGLGVVETDSGVVVTDGVGGALARITTTNENGKLLALSFGSAVATLKPSTNGPIVFDITIAQVSAITLRALFVGFVGVAADALAPVVTGAVTTLTLVADDLVGVFFDVGLTDGDGYFFPHNKANESVSIATTATGVDLSTTVSAAGTETRIRIEVLANGTAVAFINKVQMTSIAAASTPATALIPVLTLESTSVAVKSADVREIGAWGVSS